MPRVHRLHRSLTLPLPRNKVFAFFAEPTNLARITPAEMGFAIVTPQPIVMESGLTIDYTVRVAGFPMRWRSRITRWDPPNEFVDQQIHGPYAHWSHAHRFRDVSEGTEIEDEVHYSLPFWPLGELGHWFVVRQLDAVFRHREIAIRRILL